MSARRVLVGTALVAGVLLGSGRAQAQEHQIGLGYGPGFPTSDSRDFIDRTSWRGVFLDLKQMRGRNTSLGLSLAWSIFDVKGERTQEVPGRNATVNGVQTRVINAFPLMGQAAWYLGDPRGIRPYVAANAGAIVIKRRLQVGIVEFDDDTWHFGAAPEVGVQVPMQWGSFVFMHARYYYGLATDDFSPGWFTVTVGFTTQ